MIALPNFTRYRVRQNASTHSPATKYRRFQNLRGKTWRSKTCSLSVLSLKNSSNPRFSLTRFIRLRLEKKTPSFHTGDYLMGWVKSREQPWSFENGDISLHTSWRRHICPSLSGTKCGHIFQPKKVKISAVRTRAERLMSDKYKCYFQATNLEPGTLSGPKVTANSTNVNDTW